MSSLLKDIYSPAFFNTIIPVFKKSISGFDDKKFNALIFDKEWKDKELKQRMRHTAIVLNKFLPADFEKAALVINRLIAGFRQSGIREQTIEFMFLPDYIELYGLSHFDVSVKLIEQVTQFTSCEYAVRPLILKYRDAMLSQMLEWSKHESHYVRRLASEGSRPRLPWAMALAALKKNPKPVLPILENLKTDTSEYVRRSVANSLNDIAKDNPAIVISIARKWKGISKETDVIIKHGCRTLLKQAHPEILKYYRLDGTKNIKTGQFKILTPAVKTGNSLEFSFTIQNTGKKANTIRLEYAVYYLKQNDQYGKKVFKISERCFGPGEKTVINRKQSFRIITTRKFYPGKHKLSLIVNGKENKPVEFRLDP